MAFCAVFDACVLYSSPLRDLLVGLAGADLFRARWTDAIHGEWIKALLRNRPDLTEEQLARTRSLMNGAVADCLVTGYEPLIPGLDLPDPNDRHVLAAAIRCGASVIVTKNLSDFSRDILAKFEIEAQHPDDFIAHLCDLDFAKVCAVVKAQRARLVNPPMSIEEFLENLLAQELPQSVVRLEKASALL